MLEYILLAIETLLLFLYPMQKTVRIWKTQSINTQSYQESLAYWIIYSTTQASRWIFPVMWFTILRVVLLFITLFTLPYIVKVLFRFQKDEKIKDS